MATVSVDRAKDIYTNMLIDYTGAPMPVPGSLRERFWDDPEVRKIHGCDAMVNHDEEALELYWSDLEMAIHHMRLSKACAYPDERMEQEDHARRYMREASEKMILMMSDYLEGAKL